MQEELSCNWKKLQAKIQTGSTRQQPSRKRKSGEQPQSIHRKRPRKSYDPESRDLTRAASSSEKLTSNMGISQSSKIEVTGRDTKTPASLGLWVGGNDPSAEDLAEAYRLGLKGNALLTAEKERPNEGLAQGVELGKYVALDCEMVGVGPDGSQSFLARASVVDFHGRQVYDSFVRPQERVTDWRTSITGIGPAQMKFARPFNEVQSQVAEILHGRILVGHDVGHDLAVLQLKHSAKDTRDTAKFLPFRAYGNGGKPSLRSLSRAILGVEIQDGVHSSIEDAKATMAVFRMHKPAFDVDHSNRFPDTSSTRQRKPTKEKAAQRKKKRIRKK
ncbi:related to 3`-5` exonuclease [Cephalotrichum gorgonifer]|uniref:RNA exonuclease 4 n=1 Tax=Cephalotrichum gorgonifer TaxID=2041049 RepID=A0AAE8N0F7_9PEZI|nr:related to 3`-5` exonuclease [Cephalotrichum gorgonifer]